MPKSPTLTVHRARGREEDVLGLDVAMDDAVRVGIVEGQADLA